MKKIIDFAYSAYHWALSFVSALWYGFPSRKITVVGITGTKGKTTTVTLLSNILEKSGKKTAFVSSATIKVGNNIGKNGMGNSMPGRFFLQKFLHDAARDGCGVAIIEVTSQGVLQHRHKFILWDRAVFLNIHPEHIEAHGSFENYLKAKISFFDYVAQHHDLKQPQFIVNGKDSNSEKFLEKTSGFIVKHFSDDEAGEIRADIPETLSGRFNKFNVSAAVVIARTLGVADSAIKQGIETFGGVEGRMDVVVRSPFIGVVDYAHTPASLEAVYKHWKSKKNRHKLICVLGSAGGGRDKWKRPEFGKIAAKYCDYVILTNEDPYDEDPMGILNQIEDGLIKEEHKPPYVKILDRKEAIETAVSEAKKGDIIICTGKGSEEFIRLAHGKKIPWSDKKTIIESIKK
jgi:UDP-N-acetylmuramoyl-L-alanyl-D-glutamate--2,6-diaminopimelate ligase